MTTYRIKMAKGGSYLRSIGGQFYCFCGHARDAQTFQGREATASAAKLLRANMDANGYPVGVTGPILAVPMSGGMAIGEKW